MVSFYADKFNLKNTTDYKTVNNITPDCWIYLQERDAIAAPPDGAGSDHPPFAHRSLSVF